MTYLKMGWLMDCKCVFYKVQIQYQQKCRYLAEPKNILAEPGGSAEPRLKNTVLTNKIAPIGWFTLVTLVS